MINDLIKIGKIASIVVAFSFGLWFGQILTADVGNSPNHFQNIIKSHYEQMAHINWLNNEINQTREIVGAHRLTYDEHQYFTRTIVYWAVRVDVEPSLLAAVAHVESAFRPGVISHAGASGVLQVMPDIWWDYVVEKCGYWYRGDSDVEICGGAYVLRHYIDRCDGDVKCALSRYNSGYIPCTETRRRGCSTAGARYAANVLSKVDLD